ncbi:hypothetical protein M2192_007172 [Bradyrhizobium elkanii USDA 61]|uniref:Uncharacterized protein n=1 Tax=Bradyrhizobium elkanii TaxID=29448 RepID=A0A8I1Y6W0_BRAEL|nr:hypothetical protein [Bradyrhizobium elkanii]MCS4010212.1 hypothetical protein [Bradyrhizobium elkanii USDA 61]MCP1926316.1 hypothetical protein [Bradyrhizobium elkanii]MCS3476142.1 hypothetical protein [Bradyrhizobium elkanii]MCS3582926.1 hypothetical protein [Bradyrhizobium elkanii]
MPGLVPGIHVFVSRRRKTWMAGTSPAMTVRTSPSPPICDSPVACGERHRPPTAAVLKNAEAELRLCRIVGCDPGEGVQVSRHSPLAEAAPHPNPLPVKNGERESKRPGAGPVPSAAISVRPRRNRLNHLPLGRVDARSLLRHAVGNGRSPAAPVSRLVCLTRLVAARASARAAGESARATLGAADRAHGSGQDAGGVLADTGGVEWRGAGQSRKACAAPSIATSPLAGEVDVL